MIYLIICNSNLIKFNTLIDILKDCLIIVVMHRLNFLILAWQQPMVMFHLSSSSSLLNSKKSFSTHKINYWIKRCQKECLFYVYIDWLFVPNFVFHAKVSEKSLQTEKKYEQTLSSKIKLHQPQQIYLYLTMIA